MSKKAGVVFLVIVLLPLVVAEELPRRRGFVNDYPNFLADTDEAVIEDSLQQLKSALNVDTVVVVVQSTGLSAEHYVVELRRSWNLSDRSLVFLVSAHDKRAHIDVGSGLAERLPPLVLERLERRVMRPYFSVERYGEGIFQTLYVVKKLVENDPVVQEHYEGTTVTNNYGWFVVAYCAFFALLLVLGRTYRYRHALWAGGSLLALEVAYFFGIPLFILAGYSIVVFWIMALGTDSSVES